jgi:EAL domain-containing protein (putative c-di-GMP-specific phosphodiesterase class I)
VQDTPDDAEDSAIARAVVALGCDEMPGYLLGRPLPAERLRQWWLDRHARPTPQPLA